MKTYEIEITKDVSTLVDADRFILSHEQGAYIFLQAQGDEKTAVAIYNFNHVVGVREYVKDEEEV